MFDPLRYQPPETDWCQCQRLPCSNLARCTFAGAGSGVGVGSGEAVAADGAVVVVVAVVVVDVGCGGVGVGVGGAVVVPAVGAGRSGTGADTGGRHYWMVPPKSDQQAASGQLARTGSPGCTGRTAGGCSVPAEWLTCHRYGCCCCWCCQLTLGVDQSGTSWPPRRKWCRRRCCCLWCRSRAQGAVGVGARARAWRRWWRARGNCWSSCCARHWVASSWRGAWQACGAWSEMGDCYFKKHSISKHIDNYFWTE